MTDRFVAGLWLHIVVRSRSSVAAEATLDRSGKLTTNFSHGKDAQCGIGWRRVVWIWRWPGHTAVREHRDQSVFQIGRRFRVGETQTSGQIGARVEQVGCRQYVEVTPGGGWPTSKRDLDVGGHRAIVLAHSGDVGDVVIGVCHGGGALDRQEVAEAERRESGDKLNPEHIPLLNFDVQPRWREDVVRDEAEVVQVANADAWNDVAVGPQSDGASSCRYVQYLGAGGVRRTRRNKHHHRRRAVVRNNHLPDGRLGQGDVGQLVPVAVALEETGAGEHAPAATVNYQGLVDGVGQRLLRVGAVGTEALALTGRRRAHGVVQCRSSVSHLFHTQVCRQLEQTVSGADEYLYNYNKPINLGFSLPVQVRYGHMGVAIHPKRLAPNHQTNINRNKHAGQVMKPCKIAYL